MTTMKHGIQITTTEDGSWSVTQLHQTTENGEFKKSGGTLFVEIPEDGSYGKLLEAISEGLDGKITKTKKLK